RLSGSSTATVSARAAVGWVALAAGGWGAGAWSGPPELEAFGGAEAGAATPGPEPPPAPQPAIRHTRAHERQAVMRQAPFTMAGPAARATGPALDGKARDRASGPGRLPDSDSRKPASGEEESPRFG